MWLVPILIIGVIVVAAASKSPREPRSLSRQLSPAPVRLALPGPISVLGEILRVGQYPPPMVVLCAIAEAEALGHRDLVADIVRAFVAPVVYQHQALNGHGTTRIPAACAPVPYERGSCGLRGSPRDQANHGGGSCLSSYDRGGCAPRSSRDANASMTLSAAAPQGASQQVTDDQILAMLHADPNAFLAMVASRRPVLDTSTEAACPAPMSPLPCDLQLDPSSNVPSLSSRGAPDLCGAVDQVQAMAPGSPIGDISDDAWRRFITSLEREPATFSSSRHVGQYRQRRERLVDLGIDPSAIHGSAAAQRTALDADLSDAYRHASAGGLTEHLSRSISVPGHEAPQVITLSGLLGVIQCAGLEGAVGWLERLSDRKRYPHTTQVFLSTNGVF